MFLILVRLWTAGRFSKILQNVLNVQQQASHYLN